MRKAFVKTYGCQMNVSDSERIRGALLAGGLEIVTDPAEADLVIFNTCSVRQKAEQKVFSDIGRLRRLKQQKHEFTIALCGCIPQVQREKILRDNQLIDLVFGVNNISRLMDYLEQVRRGERVCAIQEEFFEDEYHTPAQRDDRYRAYVTVMNGCDNFCSYCIVPYTRGRERSRSLPSILAEVERLLDDGVREITLLGQNVNSYHWRDGSSSIRFPELLQRVHDFHDLQRLRFVTSHPKDFTPAMVEAMKLPKVCKYLHLPAQSGSNRILQQMNRGYTREQYLERIGLLREEIPGVALSSDFLVGFPGETEDDFQQTMDLVRQVGYRQIFGFNYSVRPETRAATMPEQVPFAIMNERLGRLFELQEDISRDLSARMLSTVQRVLVEGPSKKNPDVMVGRTDCNAVVHFVAPPDMPGKMADIHITQTREFTLYGDIQSRVNQHEPVS
ncbi:tRNA (N6-isopentenyl adenosine(37)-C2)-methylthiotransferase MiaB [Desulfurispira natronophila]|uniref:tRNA-2-methylthio-N(6)-dimethylallyladenosine synthase n=1 Tax=Desulfurispira natronophila TaxID=682562 RepID=A0A7W8DH44_9BACT|nr:tRNA (N6-isopentenyl adenosine(37)-C2)-methylthiotransferase MiaB [Desulfurispira natronophila]MBB5022186.1 tRNA-2-methylthio-N6-dimethylallyladenosine synthase [Desulfurispira natronophila]